MHSFPLSWLIVAFTLYSGLLFFISWLTTRRAQFSSFFVADRRSNWFLIAYGMVGTSLTGVTFISVPGNVLNQNFFYMPLVLGFMVGYIVVAKLLIPLYYRMNLISIYGYLEERFGYFAYRSGAALFIISRVLGAAVRIFIAILVLHTFIPPGAIPFWVVAFIFIAMIFLYTFRGGVRTIIWTDILQTTLMLLALLFTIYSITKELNWGVGEMVANVIKSDYSRWFNWQWSDGNNAIKQFVAGIFITVAMTGLDQEMMQKSLTCKSIGEAQKNIYTTSITIFFVNLFFLLLGALLALYINELHGGMVGLGLADSAGHFSKAQTDKLFPIIASQYLGLGVGLIFIIGLISASYPSAAGALTSLTTSFCIDFVGFERRDDLSDSKKGKIRVGAHATFALLFFIIALLLKVLNNQTIIDLIYLLASYTYGPLLGLFAFGIFTNYDVKDRYIPYITLLAPLLCFTVDSVAKGLFNFGFGFTILIMNGLFTFIGIYLIRERGSDG